MEQNQDNQVAQISADRVLLQAIGAIEQSGCANAGIGCNLTETGSAELEASFAGVTYGLTQNSAANTSASFGSVAAVPYISQ